MSYAVEWAGALADITAAGASVTFSELSAGTYDAATDTTTGASDVSVLGAAIQVKGNPIRYAQLGITEMEVATLLFAPATYGDAPSLGSSVTWGSVVFRVMAVDPVSPDGSAIIARVIVAR